MALSSCRPPAKVAQTSNKSSTRILKRVVGKLHFVTVFSLGIAITQVYDGRGNHHHWRPRVLSGGNIVVRKMLSHASFLVGEFRGEYRSAVPHPHTLPGCGWPVKVEFAGYDATMYQKVINFDWVISGSLLHHPLSMWWWNMWKSSIMPQLLQSCVSYISVRGIYR